MEALSWHGSFSSPRGRRILPFLGAAVICLAAYAPLAAQAPRPFFDSFLYSYSTPPSKYWNPGDPPGLCCPSPNGIWMKRGGDWNCYLAPQMVWTTGGKLDIRVKAYAGPPPPKAYGGQVETQFKNAFGSYMACFKVAGFTGNPSQGVCNAFFYWSKQAEIDMEFRSRWQGAFGPGTGLLDIVMHTNLSGGGRKSYQYPVILNFDPSKAFHTYRFDWYTNKVEFYVDSKLMLTVPNAVVPTPDMPGKLYFNAWTGKTDWSGNPPNKNTDFLIQWVNYTPVYFKTDKTKLRISTGGQANFFLDALPARANRAYVILTTLKETNLGQPLGGNLHLPLDLDWSTFVFLPLANTSTFPGFIGTFDAQGKATAAMNLPTGLGPSAVGLKLHFAYLGINASLNGFTVASNPITITLVP